MTHGSETGENLRDSARKVGLPPRPFLYTIDQIATILNLTEFEVNRRYLYFEGRTVGAKTRDQMVARNIAPANSAPEWRIAELELVRWMRRKGFRYYDRGSARS